MTPIHAKYKELLAQFGHPVHLWPQWCAPHKSEALRQLVIIGSVLVQRTSWKNAELALENLKDSNLLSLEAIANIDTQELTSLIRSAGFYTTKPRRLQEIARFIIENYGDLTSMKVQDSNILREQLLKVYGIGSETADVILLYGLDQPHFVIDEYAKRFVIKHKFTDKLSYDELQSVFIEALPKDTEIYQNYHVLLMADQKDLELCRMAVVEVEN